MLGSLIKNVEGVEKNETVSNKRKSLDKLYAMRWIEQDVFKRLSLIIAACNSCGKNVSQKLCALKE